MFTATLQCIDGRMSRPAMDVNVQTCQRQMRHMHQQMSQPLQCKGSQLVNSAPLRLQCFKEQLTIKHGSAACCSSASQT